MKESECEMSSMSELSRKHVQDWRWREGQWTRRSRLVAGEFGALNPFLDDLYSPASISSTMKVLAALSTTDPKLNLYSLDVSDAYWKVPQRTPWQW